VVHGQRDAAFGVVLDSKLDFPSHINSLVVKAFRMLVYIRRIGKEFRGPYTLKTLYNSFVRSHLEYASVVWNPYYGVHLKRIGAIQKRFLRFVLRTLGWSRDIELPPYCQRCRLIDLAVFISRRRVLYALFISDVLSCKLDCPIILSLLRLNVCLYNVRYLCTRKILAEQIMEWMSPWMVLKRYLMNFRIFWVWR
jgi:hypothetical protein